MCRKNCRESRPCHYYHRCSYSDQRITPISEDKGISYLDIAKIEKETQYRLCSSSSQVSGRGARWKTNASKQKEICAQHPAFHGTLKPICSITVIAEVGFAFPSQPYAIARGLTPTSSLRSPVHHVGIGGSVESRDCPCSTYPGLCIAQEVSPSRWPSIKQLPLWRRP
jgi:hypothetical protein